LREFSFPPIVIPLRGGQAPGQGHRIEDMMSHDKITAAARKRRAETGEPYTAARRAVMTGHRAAEGQNPPSDAGYTLTMSAEIHDWLAELRGDDPQAATRTAQALVTLMEKGASLGEPLVASTADSWPAALIQALDRSYEERLARLTAMRGNEADAAILVKDIQDQIAALETTQAKLEDLHRRALDAGQANEATDAADKLAAVHDQIARARQLLPGVSAASRRLGQVAQRLQARAEGWRARKETLKASYTAASGSLRVGEAIAALNLASDDGGPQRDDSGEAISAAAGVRLAELTAQMERELGQEDRPEGLMELRPGAPLRSDIRILFAVEPPGTALLIAVLQGLEIVEDQFPEAVMASADLLRRVRAGQAPEAAAHAYTDARSLPC
jgi:phage shock protein A